MSKNAKRTRKLNYKEILKNNPSRQKQNIKEESAKQENAARVSVNNKSEININNDGNKINHNHKYSNRKYVEYGIKVTYLNGEVEYLNLKKQKVDTSKFKKVIGYYNKFKKNCINKMVDRIDIIGTTEKGKRKVIFFKDIKYKEEVKNPYTNMETLDLMNDMLLMVQALKMKDVNSLQRIQIALEKKQDIILHKIEHVDLVQDDREEEEKKLFNELKSIRDERRKVKTEILLIENFNKRVNLSNIEDQINIVVKTHSKKKKSIRYLTDKLVEELKMMKEIEYKTIAQSKIIKQQIQGDYDRVINDEVNHKLYCYNNAKQNW